jgi:hypothetical protein
MQSSSACGHRCAIDAARRGFVSALRRIVLEDAAEQERLKATAFDSVMRPSLFRVSANSCGKVAAFEERRG